MRSRCIRCDPPCYPIVMDRYPKFNLASVRNILRLPELTSTVEANRIAKALQESTSKFKAQEEDCGDVCCPLPFSLQDLCLLVVISDLDYHQVKLLASLPHWLRHRLLSILPALDLCRLEHTPLATGVDVNIIWNSKWKEQNLPVPTLKKPVKATSMLGLHPQLLSPSSSKEGSQGTESFFQFNVSKVDNIFSAHLPNRPLENVLLKEIKLAFRGLEECKLPHGKKSLLKMASDILTNYSRVDLNVAAYKLISIQGDVVFSNLLTGFMHQPCSTSECSQRVWKKQATALAVNVYPTSFTWRQPYTGGEQVCNIQLTPHRLLPILHRHDPLELLTLLTRDHSLQPSSANVHIDSISQSFLLDLSAERLALDSGITLPSDSVTCTLIVNNILERVVILRLQCDNYSNVGVMIGVIKAATVNGAGSQLKYLFCTMPNIYMDLVQPFSTLFSLQNFQQLTIKVDEAYLSMLSKLLQEFMVALCPHTHKLMILTKKDMLLPTSLKTNQLAALGTGSVSLPSYSAEHKILEFSSRKEFTSALYLLLQLPTIRLREIALVNLHKHYQYLHLCAIHPDLQTTKLVIDIGTLDSSQFLATIQADLVSLFKIPPLQKIIICGIWGGHMEAKLGLVQGLHSRSHLPPLRKVALELGLANSYKMRDFQMLSNAIFSLPQLENLKVVLGKGFADMMRQPGYEGIMYKSWIYRASKVKLKSICLRSYETKFEQLSLITQKLSFLWATYPRPIPQRRTVMLWGGCYDDVYYDYDYTDYDSDDC